MILKKIVLKNFRNYEEQEIVFNDKFNYIYGNNGQGKTNILEAVSHTTFGKSFLGSAEADCIKFGRSDFTVESDFENDLGNIDRVIVNYNSISKSKSIHKNREKVNAFSSEIFGRFPIVFLSPKSLTITYGNPSDRRKFFDIIIAQTSRLYLDFLKELSKTLKQKNALLRSYSMFRKYSIAELKNLLTSYNEKLTEVSANIIFKRLNFLIEFESFFKKNYSFLIPEENSAEISYSTDFFDQPGAGDSPDMHYIRNRVEKLIYEKFDEEINRGLSLAGPQRDDYVFKIGKNDDRNARYFELKNFASQGEHKTFLAALKLSEYDFLKHKKSTSPVLLLDDILSELDEMRVSKIISHLKEFGQIFLTTTKKEYKENLGKFYGDNEISVFQIQEGRVI